MNPQDEVKLRNKVERVVEDFINSEKHATISQREQIVNTFIYNVKQIRGDAHKITNTIISVFEEFGAFDTMYKLEWIAAAFKNIDMEESERKAFHTKISVHDKTSSYRSRTT